MASDMFLNALLDSLLPGSAEWPAASSTHLPKFLCGRSAEFARIAEALDKLQAMLPSDFAARDTALRTADLHRLETAEPALLALIVDEAFRGYYTDQTVLSVIEKKTGYPARPPQPLGRRVQSFDWSTLSSRSIGAAAAHPDPDHLGAS